MRKLEIENAWVERILECRGSVETVAEFCLERGIKRDTYYYWRRVLKKRRPDVFAQVNRKGSASKNSAGRASLRKEKKFKKPGFERLNFSFSEKEIKETKEAKEILEIILPNRFQLNFSADIDCVCLEKILMVLEARSC